MKTGKSGCLELEAGGCHIKLYFTSYTNICSHFHWINFSIKFYVMFIKFNASCKILMRNLIKLKPGKNLSGVNKI